jgi:hypothetical protein
MTRATIILQSNADRQRAAAWAQKAPDGTRIEFKAVKRSLPQNDRMWAMLTDIARQVVWDERKLTANDWKVMFLDSLWRAGRIDGTRAVRNLDNTGYVDIGRSSADLSKEEMSDMIELMQAFGAERGVKFGGGE